LDWFRSAAIAPPPAISNRYYGQNFEARLDNFDFAASNGYTALRP
jgi:hypothetical protein